MLGGCCISAPPLGVQPGPEQVRSPRQPLGPPRPSQGSSQSRDSKHSGFFCRTGTQLVPGNDERQQSRQSLEVTRTR